MPKEKIKGVVVKHGDKTSLSGRKFAWFFLKSGPNQDAVYVMGFYPQGVGPRCSGLEHIRKGAVVGISGKRKDNVFFADEVVQLDRHPGPNNRHPAKPGPWKSEATLVAFRNGKERDWLELVLPEGEQVSATMALDVLDRSCLGKKFEFSGHASRSGFRHCKEARALEDT